MTADWDSIVPPQRVESAADLEAATRWIVTDAPADYDEVMASVPRLRAWISVPLLLVAALGAWALVIWAGVWLLAR